MEKLFDLLEESGILEQAEEAFNEISEKAYDFCDKLDEFADSLGRSKTNNYGDLLDDD